MGDRSAIWEMSRTGHNRGWNSIMGGFGCIREGELNQGGTEEIVVELRYGRDVGITWEENSTGERLGKAMGDLGCGRNVVITGANSTGKFERSRRY